MLSFFFFEVIKPTIFEKGWREETFRLKTKYTCCHIGKFSKLATPESRNSWWRLVWLVSMKRPWFWGLQIWKLLEPKFGDRFRKNIRSCFCFGNWPNTSHGLSFAALFDWKFYNSCWVPSVPVRTTDYRPCNTDWLPEILGNMLASNHGLNMAKHKPGVSWELTIEKKNTPMNLRLVFPCSLGHSQSSLIISTHLSTPKGTLMSGPVQRSTSVMLGSPASWSENRSDGSLTIKINHPRVPRVP